MAKDHERSAPAKYPGRLIVILLLFGFFCRNPFRLGFHRNPGMPAARRSLYSVLPTWTGLVPGNRRNRRNPPNRCRRSPVFQRKIPAGYLLRDVLFSLAAQKEVFGYPWSPCRFFSPRSAPKNSEGSDLPGAGSAGPDLSLIHI